MFEFGCAAERAEATPDPTATFVDACLATPDQACAEALAKTRAVKNEAAGVIINSAAIPSGTRILAHPVKPCCPGQRRRAA
jgi:hypothetical protein